ncbi:MAG: pantoate--beta-alanine ligase [Calditrichia bacterium]
MKVYKTIAEIRDYRNSEQSLQWGLVATMGFLHAGHLSLVKRAKQENERVVVSVFVNPIQFNNAEDLSSYPQDIERDLQLLKTAGVDAVWLPDAGEMYPENFQTYIDVEEISLPLEGAMRPGHFRGVTTVVGKLFNVVQPQRAYFGQKDAQQVAVIRQMVRDLAFPIDLVVCPILREEDGLAMSSRNVRLGKTERAEAVVLNKALQMAKQLVVEGEREVALLLESMNRIITTASTSRVEYISVTDATTLKEISEVVPKMLLSVAVFFGEVRLIDNVLIESE